MILQKHAINSRIEVKWIDCILSFEEGIWYIECKQSPSLMNKWQKCCTDLYFDAWYNGIQTEMKMKPDPGLAFSSYLATRVY